MYCQIGKILFDGLFGFDSLSSTDSTAYAQHDLINAKPILQPVGNDLEELSIAIKLRAEFVKPEEAILELKKSKDTFEILPLLKGNGRFMGNFVITQMEVTETQTFADGTTIEATVSLTLREYATADKLQQQQVAARKQAFATGDKKAMNFSRTQTESVSQLAVADISATQARADVVELNVSSYENNVSGQQAIEARISSTLNKVATRLNEFGSKLELIEGLTDPDAIAAAIAIVQQRINEFVFPVGSSDDLKRANQNFQQAVTGLKSTCAELINNVITRAA